MAMRRRLLYWLPACLSPVVGAAQRPAEIRRDVEIVIAATTDVHGRVRGWDYYGDMADTARGLARAATIVDSVREANPGRVVLVDAGDFLQGNPLAFVSARVRQDQPIASVAAMNVMRYDAVAIGNHEFDYGLDYLARARRQARFPMLSANARGPNGSRPYAASRVVIRAGVRIGIVGATTPGASIWNRDRLRGRLTLGDMVQAISREVTTLERRGVDVVVAVIHGGLNEPASYDTASTGLSGENVATRLAEAVPAIDAIVYGHTHKEMADTTVGNTLLLQPRNWAGSVALATLTLERDGGSWRVRSHRGQLVPTSGHVESPAVLAATARQHTATLRYVRAPIGTTTVSWRADSSRVSDTPLVDFMLEVMRRRSGANLAATASFSLSARLDSGAIPVAEVSRLYPYENTLRAVRVSGAELRAYLEHSARYFRDTSSTAAPLGSVDQTIPGYNFDIVAGADYTIDIARPIGSRLTRLDVGGRPVVDSDTFTLALNNYRQAGSGGYGMLTGAPVVYDRQEDIRQLLIDEVRRRGTLDPRDYATRNWRLEPAEARAVAYRSMQAAPGGAASIPRLRVIATNDFHGALEPRRDAEGVVRGGALALAAEVARARQECVAPACESIYLDGGDQFQGTPASNLTFGLPVVRLFNRLGLAAAALGNHEFDWTQETLRQRMRDARYPILGANVRYADGRDVPWIPDDTLLMAGSVRVGVIGLASVETSSTTNPTLVADLRFVDPAPIVDERARALRARGAQYVVVVAHAGAFCNRQDARNCEGEIVTLAERVTERIDAFVSGHTHSAVATVVKGAAIVQARSRGTTLGVIDIQPNHGHSAIALRDVLPAGAASADSVVSSVVESATASLRERMSKPIVRIGERMSSGSRGTLGDLIADAQRAAGGGDVAVMNTGGVRASLDTGLVTYGMLFEVAPFGNRLVRLTVTGRALRDYLERVVSHSPVRAHLSGAQVRYDPSRPAGSRVTEVRLASGRAIDDEATYRLVLSDFLVAGGDGLNLSGTAVRIEPLNIVDLDALIDYLRSQPEPVRAPTDRRLVPTTP